MCSLLVPAPLAEHKDLSSFAMLLLETSDVHRAELDRDMVVDHVSPDGDCHAVSPGGTARGIKNFFRKRHKSNSSGGSPTVNSIRPDSKESSPSSSAPGSKIRSVWNGNRATGRTEMMPVNGVCDPARRCTYSVQSDTIEILTEYSSAGGGPTDRRRNRSSGDSGVAMSLQNVYRTPGHSMLSSSLSASMYSSHGHHVYQRSCSNRESQIGPNEFVEMYRSRAYSDPRLVDRTRMLAERRRRLSVSPPVSPGSLTATVGAFEPRQMIIWKDQITGTHVFRLPSTDEEDFLEIGNIDESDDLIFVRFLKSHTCYDVLPTSNKLVILDTQLNVKKAFYALVDNGIRSAPLWDTDAQTIVGMFTVTDFIRILLKYHSASQFAMEDIEGHTIATWTELLADVHSRRLISVGPDATMLEAIRQLCLHRIHRLPVIDPESGNLLCSLTHKRLLQYLYFFFQHYGLRSPSFMEQTLDELGIGTFTRIAVVRMDTRLLVALDLFISRRVSSLPVVDAQGRLVAVYSKSEAMNLAAEKTYANLSDSVEQILGSRKSPSNLRIQAMTCNRSESLTAVIDRIIANDLHRLYAVDSEQKVIGVVSLSDILRRLVLSPDETRDSPNSSSLFDDQLLDICCE